jgi:hypothetical protein
LKPDAVSVEFTGGKLKNPDGPIFRFRSLHPKLVIRIRQVTIEFSDLYPAILSESSAITIEVENTDFVSDGIAKWPTTFPQDLSKPSYIVQIHTAYALNIVDCDFRDNDVHITSSTAVHVDHIEDSVNVEDCNFEGMSTPIIDAPEIDSMTVSSVSFTKCPSGSKDMTLKLGTGSALIKVNLNDCPLYASAVVGSNSALSISELSADVVDGSVQLLEGSIATVKEAMLRVMFFVAPETTTLEDIGSNVDMPNAFPADSRMIVGPVQDDGMVTLDSDNPLTTTKWWDSNDGNFKDLDSNDGPSGDVVGHLLVLGPNGYIVLATVPVKLSNARPFPEGTVYMELNVNTMEEFIAANPKGTFDPQNPRSLFRPEDSDPTTSMGQIVSEGTLLLNSENWRWGGIRPQGNRFTMTLVVKLPDGVNHLLDFNSQNQFFGLRKNNIYIHGSEGPAVTPKYNTEYVTFYLRCDGQNSHFDMFDQAGNHFVDFQQGKRTNYDIVYWEFRSSSSIRLYIRHASMYADFIPDEDLQEYALQINTKPRFKKWSVSNPGDVIPTEYDDVLDWFYNVLPPVPSKSTAYVEDKSKLSMDDAGYLVTEATATDFATPILNVGDDNPIAIEWDYKTETASQTAEYKYLLFCDGKEKAQLNTVGQSSTLVVDGQNLNFDIDSDLSEMKRWRLYAWSKGYGVLVRDLQGNVVADVVQESESFAKCERFQLRFDWNGASKRTFGNFEVKKLDPIRPRLSVASLGSPVKTIEGVSRASSILDQEQDVTILVSFDYNKGKSGILYESGGNGVGVIVYIVEEQIYCQAGDGSAAGGDEDRRYELQAAIEGKGVHEVVCTFRNNKGAQMWLNGESVDTSKAPNFDYASDAGAGGSGQVYDTVAKNRAGWISEGQGQGISVLHTNVWIKSLAATVILLKQKHPYVFADRQLDLNRDNPESSNYATLLREDFEKIRSSDGKIKLVYEFYKREGDAEPYDKIKFEQTSNPHDSVQGFKWYSEETKHKDWMATNPTGMYRKEGQAHFDIDTATNWYMEIAFKSTHRGYYPIYRGDYLPVDQQPRFLVLKTWD